MTQRDALRLRRSMFRERARIQKAEKAIAERAKEMATKQEKTNGVQHEHSR